MTSVVARFQYQGTLSGKAARRLGESHTHLGVRDVTVNEAENTIAIEYDATCMDRNGLAALLRRFGVALSGA